MNFAEHLKSQLNIVEVVGQYVRLKRQGAGPRWVGLCPFHSEKTPSFGVHSGHQYYKCFGCEASGDIFNFVQQLENLTFPETLRLLAERYGVPMPERQRADDAEAQQTAALLEIHEAAAELFQNNLRAPDGAETRQYLQSRGVTADAMREFRLGLSDGSGQQLSQRLKRFGEALLLDSGLVAKREQSSGVYDRFRSRLMFPIHSDAGKVIAFGGRALRPEDKVKYLNSPETKLYTKSSILYNMHRAKTAARKNNRMILVEGYMDAIALYSAGVHEVVASCGTSLTVAQVKVIRRHLAHQNHAGCQIYLSLDPDEAGQNATLKKYDLLEAEFQIRVVELLDGVDVDECIHKHGSQEYERRLAEAPTFYNWLKHHTLKKFDTRTVEGRIEGFRYMKPIFERVRNPAEREAIVREAAAFLRVDPSVVLKEFRPTELLAAKPTGNKVSSTLPPNEKVLVACMLASADARSVVRHYFAGSEDLQALELKPVFEAIMAAESPDAGFSLPDAISKLEPRLQQILVEISFSECDVKQEQAVGQAVDCLRRLEAVSLEAKFTTLKKQIRESEVSGNAQEAFRLTIELDRLKRESARV